MGLEAALTALLGSGVVEKGLLVWMILQLNGQGSNISENKSKLSEISYKIQTVEAIRLELLVLKQELDQIKDKCGKRRECFLESEKQKNLESKNSEP